MKRIEWCAAVLLLCAAAGAAETVQEKSLGLRLDGLRGLSDDARAVETKRLALDIRALPSTANKVELAEGLANLATEGDFGRDALQETAATLAAALRERPVPREKGLPASPYAELAELVRYERVNASLDDPQFRAAQAALEEDDRARGRADFTLTDLSGKSWSLKKLAGKVVMVNFWATWCPPCRKEMPALDSLYSQFKDKGLVILAISDEEAGKVAPFVAARKTAYPVLLDPGRKAHELFRVRGIPKTFVYDRAGKLVSQSIDMRTERQFLEMLAQAGLK